MLVPCHHSCHAAQISPNHPGMMPSRVSGKANCASRPATRTSQASASSAPPPNANLRHRDRHDIHLILQTCTPKAQPFVYDLLEAPPGKRRKGMLRSERATPKSPMSGFAAIASRPCRLARTGSGLSQFADLNATAAPCSVPNPTNGFPSDCSPVYNGCTSGWVGKQEGCRELLSLVQT